MLKVTVVIPTYNRKIMLNQCLESLGNQSLPSSLFEVIIVDDGSTDGTEEFLQAKDFKFGLIYLKQKNKGPSAARNLGIKNAKGEYIAFTDDDCTVEKNWLDEAIKCFNSDNVGGVGGAVRQRTNGIISDYWTYHRGLESPTINNEVIYLVTINSCYRRDILLAVLGFEEKIRTGEDIDLSVRIREKGFVLKYNPAMIVSHHYRENLRNYYRTFYDYGRGADFLWRKWGKKSAVVPPQTLVHQLLGFNNLRLFYGYYKNVGLRKALLFWLLRRLQLFAWSRGFKKGYWS